MTLFLTTGLAIDIDTIHTMQPQPDASIVVRFLPMRSGQTASPIIITAAEAAEIQDAIEFRQKQPWYGTRIQR